MSFGLRKSAYPTFVVTASTTPTLWSQNGNNIYNNNTGGNVGINNSNPIYTLDVSSSLPAASMRIISPTFPNVLYQCTNNNLDMSSGVVVSQIESSARFNNGSGSIYRAGAIYNGDGTTRRGRYVEGISAGGNPSSFQRVMTNLSDGTRINIIGQNAGTYIDNSANSDVAYNMHASNIINATTSGSSLELLSLDVNGITQHKFFKNGNVTFGGTTNNAKAIVDISSTTKGFMPPRMTGAQALAINPTASEAGLMVYATSTSGAITAVGWWGWDGTAWKQLG